MTRAGPGSGDTAVQRVLRASSLFDRLGLPDAAVEAAVLRRRYREVALQVHPDKCADAKAKEAFQKLSEAFDRLSSLEGQQRYLCKRGRATGTAADRKQRRQSTGVDDDCEESGAWWDTQTWEEFEQRLRHREAAEAALRQGFEHGLRARLATKRVKAHVLAAERSVEHCDRAAGRARTDLWPLAEARSQRGELDDFAYASRRLERVLLHLRTVHAYCHFCGCAFASLTELERSCPGVTEEAHEAGQRAAPPTQQEELVAAEPSSNVALLVEDPLDKFMAGLHEEVQRDLKGSARSEKNRHQTQRGWSFQQQEQQNKNERKRLKRG